MTRTTGRFQYIELEAYWAKPGERPSRAYKVVRVSDGRWLGRVYRVADSRAWQAQPREAVAPLPGQQARREWAADRLDADALWNQYCRCGASVSTHDRSTRYAARAWAVGSNEGADADASRARAAAQAAWYSRTKSRHYRVEGAVEHARRYASPAAPGHIVLVKPCTAPSTWVLVSPDSLSGGHYVYEYVGDRLQATHGWSDPDMPVGHIQTVYEARGYRPVYDWRT